MSKLLLSFLIVLLWNCQAACRDHVTIYYVNRIPYHYLNDDGKLTGLVATPILKGFEKAAIPYTVKELPAKRILFYLRMGAPNVCGIGWYKNSEREKFAKYSKPVYQNRSRIAITRHDNDLIATTTTLERVLATPAVTLIVKSGYSYGKYIDDQITKLQPKIYKTTKSNDAMLAMVYKRKCNYFLLSEEEADALIPAAGYQKSDFRYIYFTDVPTGLKRHMICSKNTSDHIISQIDKAIESFDH